MKNFRQYIFHIDFDSYFVNASKTVKYWLKNTPVVIAKNDLYSIAVSASYDLKNKGAKVGMKVKEILAIEPKTIVIEPDFELYRKISNDIFYFLGKNYCENIEIASIDECYLTFSINEISSHESALKIAKEIKQNILNLFQIPITIGISQTKWYAKMATNHFKPDNIGIINYENYKEIIYKKDISEFHSIGPSLSQKLRKIGVIQIEDLLKFTNNDAIFRSVFGSTGFKYLDMLDFEIGEFSYSKFLHQNKSIGNMITLQYGGADQESILNALNKLCENVSKRLKKMYQLGNLIALDIRQVNKKWISKNHKIKKHTNDLLEIKKYIFNLYQQNFEDDLIIGVGVRVAGLISQFDYYEKVSLFDTKIKYENKTVDNIISNINRQLKKEKVMTLNKHMKLKEKEKDFNKYSVPEGIFKK
ncbi:hypothetical protein [Mycoplasma leonicaptivi]|uniref:Y-family DNA polymerase n=1 Tax=Mycoplasma leonicaptivi TaxID=36742 RepID=UPI000481C4EE|nr:hypothetical protein [Mycoplasma leonicaptivi]